MLKVAKKKTLTIQPDVRLCEKLQEQKKVDYECTTNFLSIQSRHSKTGPIRHEVLNKNYARLSNVTSYRLVDEYERLEEPAVGMLLYHNTGVNLKPNKSVVAEYILDGFTT
jgi:hypothetical protein